MAAKIWQIDNKKLVTRLIWCRILMKGGEYNTNSPKLSLLKFLPSKVTMQTVQLQQVKNHPLESSARFKVSQQTIQLGSFRESAVYTVASCIIDKDMLQLLQISKAIDRPDLQHAPNPKPQMKVWNQESLGENGVKSKVAAKYKYIVCTFVIPFILLYHQLCLENLPYA